MPRVKFAMHQKYRTYPSPPGPIQSNGMPLSPEQWANAMLDKVPNVPGKLPKLVTRFGEDISILDLDRRRIALFNDFPPEYVDYYKALQEEIARRIPEEQERPLICLAIKGGNRLGDNGPADVGLAGGTGPLSDATLLDNLVRHMSGVKNQPFNLKTRAIIADAMQNFSGVLYSMPPIRDKAHGLDAPAYLSLYKHARQDMPCTSLHILTNTGHTNKNLFNKWYVLGKKKFGDVDDMTIKVAHFIQKESKPKDRVLVLGTTDAAKKKLYPNLLQSRDLAPVLPSGVFQDTDAQTYLQRIIDQAKANGVNENMPGEARTCGQAFIDLVLEHAQKTRANSLLFSCTELPMLLHTKIPGSDQTYIKKLEEELIRLNLNCKLYDTEELFVKEIAKKSFILQDHPEMRSNMLLGKGHFSTYHELHAKLDSVKAEMIAHCHKFSDVKNEVQQQKKNVLMATLQFFDDGNVKALNSVIAANPRYDEATLGSKTLRLVSKGIKFTALIQEDKAKMDSFKGLKEQLQNHRDGVLAQVNVDEIDLQGPKILSRL